MDEEKKKKPRIQRASNDELEVMKEIISENHGLFLRVMDVLRKSRNRDSIFDIAQDKQRKVGNKVDG